MAKWIEVKTYKNQPHALNYAQVVKGRKRHAYLNDTCGNCQQQWPCECDDPVMICGVCGSDGYECQCSERNFEDYDPAFDDRLDLVRNITKAQKRPSN